MEYFELLHDVSILIKNLNNILFLCCMNWNQQMIGEVCCNEQIVDWMDRCRGSLFRGKSTKYQQKKQATGYC